MATSAYRTSPRTLAVHASLSDVRASTAGRRPRPRPWPAMTSAPRCARPQRSAEGCAATLHAHAVLEHRIAPHMAHHEQADAKLIPRAHGGQPVRYQHQEASVLLAGSCGPTATGRVTSGERTGCCELLCQGGLPHVAPIAGVMFGLRVACETLGGTTRWAVSPLSHGGGPLDFARDRQAPARSFATELGDCPSNPSEPAGAPSVRMQGARRRHTCMVFPSTSRRTSRRRATQ